MVVNEVGDEFLNYYKSLNSQRSEENAQSIREMVDSQQNTVDSLGQKLLSVKISQGSLDPESKTASAMANSRARLESSLAEEKGKYNEHSNRVQYLNDELKNASVRVS